MDFDLVKILSHMHALAQAHIQHPLIYPELLRAKNSATAGTREHIALGSSSSSSSKQRRFWQRDTNTHTHAHTKSFKCRRNGKVRNNRWIYISGRRRQPSWICVCHTNALAHIHTQTNTHLYIQTNLSQSERKKKRRSKKLGLLASPNWYKMWRWECVCSGVCECVLCTHTHILHMNVCLYLNSISSSALHDLFIILFNFVTTGRTKEEKNTTSGKTIWNYEFNIDIFECLHILLWLEIKADSFSSIQFELGKIGSEIFPIFVQYFMISSGNCKIANATVCFFKTRLKNNEWKL